MVKIFLKSNVHKPKTSQTRSYVESTLFPVFPLEKLLPDLEKKHYLNKVQEIVTLPDDYFKVIYEDLIDNFAMLVQTLPESYGEELGGLLNDGLRRALLAIQILNETSEDKPHPLFLFAIFSIALLSDVGQVVSYRVMISDDKGNFIDDWYPYLGFISEFGDYFKLRPFEATPTSLIYGATPILARQLLTETGMAWLASNNQILDMWFAFLYKGENWAGGLGKILKIDRKQFENRAREAILFPVDIPLFDPLATELGERFWEWLKKGIEDGSITYNESDSLVHVVKSNELELGLFLQAPELFQQFCHVHFKYRDWIVVCKQFNHLGLTKLSGSDYKFEQFFSDTPDFAAKKLGFLRRETSQERKAATEPGLLPSRMMTTSRNIKEGVVIKDARNIFGSKVPGVSPHLQGVEIRWRLDNVLPKIRETKPALSPNVKLE